MLPTAHIGTRHRVAVLLLALAACAAPGRRGPAGSPPARGSAARIAVLPVHDLTADRAPLAAVDRALASALRRRGIEVIDASELEPFLARHRIRYTGGIDRDTAHAARSELQVDAVLISVLEQHSRERFPRVAITMRLVDVAREPSIVWVDSVGRSGDDAPGWLDLGVIRDMSELEQTVFGTLSRSLATFLAGKRPRAIGCRRAPRFRPRTFYRSMQFSPTARRTVAVLPFVNHTPRRGAGELVAQQFIRQLQTTTRFEVLEPGVVRARLLATRSILSRGISLAQARLLLDLLRADTVLVGDVFEFDSGAVVPAVDFSVTMLDGRNDRIVWRSASHNHGDDGVQLFELGRVSTASALSCHMIASVVDALQLGQRRAAEADTAARSVLPPPQGKGP